MTERGESESSFKIGFSDPSQFDFWATSPLRTASLSQEDLFDEENISKFFKVQIFQNYYLKVNSDELLDSCLKLVKTRTLSEANQVLFLKLISSLSTSHHSANIIKSKGLLEWVKQNSLSDSPKLFLEAWKILQNVAANTSNSPLYLDGIYPFTPPWIAQDVVADIILVHGIKGGAAWTWRQHDSQRERNPVLTQHQRVTLLNGLHKDNALSNQTYTWIWPLDWLSQGITQPFRIIAVDYPAHWWQWFDEDGDTNRDLCSLSQDLLVKLKICGVGTRPIIWIAHSMGGIIVKKMLQQEAFREGENHASPNLSASTRAVVFLSVPHFGSPLASWSCSLAPLLRPSLYIYQMKADCPCLLKMHKDFLEFCEQKSVQVLTLNETLPYKITRNGPNFTFVPSKYGNPGVGEFHEVAATHLDICKPEGRSDLKFKLIEDFLIKIFGDLTER